MSLIPVLRLSCNCSCAQHGEGASPACWPATACRAQKMSRSRFQSSAFSRGRGRVACGCGRSGAACGSGGWRQAHEQVLKLRQRQVRHFQFGDGNLRGVALRNLNRSAIRSASPLKCQAQLGRKVSSTQNVRLHCNPETLDVEQSAPCMDLLPGRLWTAFRVAERSGKTCQCSRPGHRKPCSSSLRSTHSGFRIYNTQLLYSKKGICWQLADHCCAWRLYTQG